LPKIDEFLEDILKKDGSDLHFMAGDPPRIRQYGKLAPLRTERLSTDFVREAIYEIMPRKALDRLETRDGTDFAYTLGTLARFRVNVLRHLNGMGAVFRAIPSQAQTLEQLKMPDAVRNLAKVSSGMILVTGKTGSGKSTTLAAMIDDINSRLKGHILTIEDPIEFVHPRKNCLISQREIGAHAASFASALLSALREDPDVILVGELRDLETISTAITAAEMGILVMATLHTNGAPGRVAALEVLVNTPAAANLIRQGKIDQLETTMQAGAAAGMRTMDSAIEQLHDQGLISGRSAYEKAINKARFEALREQD
jgi:twitching motility protein PilT